jgi:glycosyltransferase involved in cell wall biosynthesis
MASINSNFEKFSVLISIYRNADPQHFKEALDSLFKQLLLPQEIVVVCDGPITIQLNLVLYEFQKLSKEYELLFFKVIYLEKNQGLGLALNEGLKFCTHNIVARFDADDICVVDRFFIQYNLFINSDLDVLGGLMKEFIFCPDDYDYFILKPLSHIKILKLSKYLNPICHPTVMFKKDAVLNSGSYKDMKFFEDYYLWIRMLRLGYKFANVNKVLVYFRVGNDMIDRRHGISYFKNELNFYKTSYSQSHINIFEFLIIILYKFILRILPRQIMKLLYKIIARKKG